MPILKLHPWDVEGEGAVIVARNAAAFGFSALAVAVVISRMRFPPSGVLLHNPRFSVIDIDDCQFLGLPSTVLPAAGEPFQQVLPLQQLSDIWEGELLAWFDFLDSVFLAAQGCQAVIRGRKARTLVCPSHPLVQNAYRKAAKEARNQGAKGVFLTLRLPAPCECKRCRGGWQPVLNLAEELANIVGGRVFLESVVGRVENRGVIPVVQEGVNPKGAYVNVVVWRRSPDAVRKALRRCFEKGAVDAVCDSYGVASASVLYAFAGSWRKFHDC
ncbi:hypothetical protein DRN94_001340 [archaeon]|nr:hypothetical protein [archaeon]